MNLSIAKLLLFVGIIYLSIMPVAGQSGIFRVISKSGIIMRDAPGRNGNKIAKIPYWERVIVNLTSQPDTLDNIPGFWVKIRYKDKEGFVFDGYLADIDSTFDKPLDYRMMQEGARCACLNYDPSLHWYGIYHTNSGDSLKKIDIEIRKPTQGPDYIPWIIIIETDQRQPSLFLIGSRKKLKEGMIGYWSNKEGTVIYPGQRFPQYANITLPDTVNTWFINATGIVTEVQDFPVFEKYCLKLSEHQRNNWKNQIILTEKDFNDKQEVPFFNFISIVCIGDIDGDRKPDFIFLISSMYVFTYRLYLSSEATNGDFIKNVAEWSEGDCI
jgi:hypothetical protein